MAVDMALRVRVTGRVQGVWFRAWTQQEAERLGLRGWVRNEADGSVSALIAGREPAVRAMLTALHDGPDLARVDRVEVAPAEDDLPEGFDILR